MGFLDSFNKSFKEESQKAEERQKTSTYRTMAQQDVERYDNLNQKSDGVLLGKLRSTNTSDKDKVIIEKILKNRGYIRATNGTYHRS